MIIKGHAAFISDIDPDKYGIEHNTLGPDGTMYRLKVDGTVSWHIMGEDDDLIEIEDAQAHMLLEEAWEEQKTAA